MKKDILERLYMCRNLHAVVKCSPHSSARYLKRKGCHMSGSGPGSGSGGGGGGGGNGGYITVGGITVQIPYVEPEIAYAQEIQDPG